MRGAILPLPQYAYMAWCSVKARVQLYLLLVYLHGEVLQQVFKKGFHSCDVTKSMFYS